MDQNFLSDAFTYSVIFRATVLVVNLKFILKILKTKEAVYPLTT